MNKFSLKTCLLLIISQLSCITYSMEVGDTEHLEQSNFESIPIELQDEITYLVVCHRIPDLRIDLGSLDVDQICGWLYVMADKLYFPISDLSISLVNKNFYEMSKGNLYKILHALTFMLNILEINTRLCLIHKLKADKTSTNLVIALLITSFLNNDIEVFEEFVATYKLIIQALNDKILELQTLNLYPGYSATNFYKKINFKLIRVKNPKLIILFINNPSIGLIFKGKKIDDPYIIEIIQQSRLGVREELLKFLRNKEIFAKLFVETDLKQAIFNGDYDLVKSMLDDGNADLDADHDMLVMPLTLAFIIDNKQIMELLLTYDSPEVAGSKYEQALLCSSANRDITVLKWLFEKYKIPKNILEKAITLAVLCQNLNAIKYFIVVEVINLEESDTLRKFLGLANIFDLKKIAKFFVPHHMKICSRLNWQLLEALDRNSLTVASFYLSNGADANTSSYLNGNKLLHLACASGNLAMVKLLIANNADVYAFNIQRKRPVDIAKLNGHIVITAFLEDIMKAKESNVIKEKVIFDELDNPSAACCRGTEMNITLAKSGKRKKKRYCLVS